MPLGPTVDMPLFSIENIYSFITESYLVVA